MKCVRCGTDNNLQEITNAGDRCQNCNHPFVFDPQTGGKFTDKFFSNSLKAISADNSLFFTSKQFWYFWERNLVPQTIPVGCLPSLSMIVVLQFTIFIGFFSYILAWIVGSLLDNNISKNMTMLERFLQFSRGLIVLIIRGLIVLVILGCFFYLVPTKALIFFGFFIGLEISIMYLGIEKFNKLEDISDKLRAILPCRLYYQQSDVIQWLKSWGKINGNGNNLLPPPHEMSETSEINSEITAYSFDRVIVCDTAEIAQFLIANNFHFEHNCAVLSIDGYPQNIFHTVMQMLRQNTDLKVYAFHSANPRGVTIINELRNSPNLFLGNNLIIYDLGLLPRHVFASKNMWVLKSDESARQAGQIPTVIKQSLSLDEVEWLKTGFYVELESFSPRKLLQVASQGIAKTQAIANGYISSSDSSFDYPDNGDEGIIFVSIGDDSSSRSSGFFASDSFG